MSLEQQVEIAGLERTGIQVRGVNLETDYAQIVLVGFIYFPATDP